MLDENLPTIQGAGGKKSGGKVTPNNLQSKARARFIEVISEGEIEGLVDGAKSIYFNQTPLQAEDGTFNFDNVIWEERKGLPDDQHLNGHSAVEQVTSVEVEVSQEIGPAIRTITDPNADAVRVIIRLQALFKTDKEGNVVNNSVHYAIDLRPAGGVWTTVVDKAINHRKTTSPTQIAHRVELPEGHTSWDLRVRRISPDETKDKNQSTFHWESYVTLIEGRFTYPHTALAAFEVNAEDLGSSIPSRAYKVKGLKISVPTNYDPVARTYAGVWNGTFKTAWTNNPAWIFYDMIVNDRYGLGEFVVASEIDKWGLYQIAQYCDELIPSGYKNNLGADILEPRYTFNGVISSREEAYFALQKITATWRGMGYWAIGQYFATADMPADPVKLVTPANVIGGKFTYSSTAMKARHTVAIVKWNDPNDFYRPASELVIHEEGLRANGWREKRVELHGCTSRGLAHRYGKWALDVENNETETVTYQASYDHADVRPGDIIAVADPRKAEARMGGRILSHFDPSLSTIKNKLRSSNDLTTASWIKSNTTVARIADNTYAIRENTITGVHHVNQGVVNTGVNTITLELKPNGRDYARLELRGQDLVFRYATLNLVTGAATLVNSALSVVSTQLEDGWWRFSVTLDYGAGTTSTNIALFTMPNGTTLSYAGDGISGVMVRNPQSEAGGVFTEYQQTSLEPIVFLDQDVTIEAGETYQVHLAMPNGNLELLNVISRPAAGQLVVAPGSSEAMPGAVFIVTSISVNPRTFRVLAVKETAENIFSVTALFHDPNKYARVEQNLSLEPISYANERIPSMPLNFLADKQSFIQDGVLRTKLSLSWSPSTGAVVRNYTLSYTSDDASVEPYAITTLTNIDIDDLRPGNYVFTLTATGRLGTTSPPATVTVTIAGAAELGVGVVSGLVNADNPASLNFRGPSPTITWVNNFPISPTVVETLEASPTYKHNEIRVYDNPTNTLLRTEIVRGVSYTYSIDANREDSIAASFTGARRQLRFEVRVVDINDVLSDPTSIVLTNPVPGAITPAISVDLASAYISWSGVADEDFRGVRAWIANDPGFDPLIAIPVFDGPGGSFTYKGVAGQTYYLKIGAYDAFSKDDMVISGPFTMVMASIEDYAAGISAIVDVAVTEAVSTIGNYDADFDIVYQSQEVFSDLAAVQESLTRSSVETEVLNRATALEAISARIDSVEAQAGDLLASVQSQNIAISNLEGNATALLGFRVKAGSADAELELVATSDPNGTTSVARISADNIILDGTIQGHHILAGSLDANAIGVGKLNARFIEVTELLSLDAGTAGFSIGKTSPMDEIDGVYMGVTGAGQFGFGASRTVGDIKQSIQIEPTKGLMIKNAKHRVLAGVPPITTNVATSQTIDLPVGSKTLSFEAVGGGGGGAASPTNKGGNGTATTITLMNGSEVVETWIAGGGLGGGSTTVHGQSSIFASGGAGAYSKSVDHGSGSTTTTYYDATPGNKGSGGGAGLLYTAKGGAAGPSLLISDYDISDLAAPKLVITLGAGGAGANAGSNSYKNGAAGGAGYMRFQTKQDKDFVADVLTIEPTARGSFTKAAGATGSVFPSLGPGLWVLSAGNSALNLGTLEVSGDNAIVIDSVQFASFIASKEPIIITAGGSNTRTINYLFYSMGQWGG